ncbi:acyltransferase family protein [Nocardia amamiensis]|uniref:acyltransferase family protein n=1 Tax=Nocardia amamiensis TaxID=404578 RepID=UPI00083741DB|nr:acyltransferase [Nocardia amamiensis]
MSAPAVEIASTKGRLPALPSLTGLRFIAAFAVFLLHSGFLVQIYPFATSDASKKLSDIIPLQLGATGVAFFFLLSGFIIDWSYDSAKDTIRAFLRRRVFKIFPSHLITALIVVVLLGFPLAELAGQIPNFLLIHTWSQDWGTSAELNSPSWSLGSEMLFYFLFPFLVPLINRIRGRAIWWTIGILSGILLAIHLIIHFAFPAFDISSMASMYPPLQKSPDITWSGYDYSAAMSASPGMPMSPDMPGSGGSSGTFTMPTSAWLSYQFPPTRLLEFFVGVMFCRLVKSGMWRNTNLAWPLVASAGAYALTYYVPMAFKTSMVMMLPLAALIATYAVRDLRGIKGIYSSRLGVWLGDVSFAFYMVGYPVQLFLQRHLIAGHSWGLHGYLFITALTFVIQLPLAAALYHLVDKPIMRRWARKKTKVTPPPDTAKEVDESAKETVASSAATMSSTPSSTADPVPRTTPRSEPVT